MEKIRSILYYFSLYWYYKLIFGALGSRTRLLGFLKLECPKNIFLGEKVHIGKYAWLASNPLTGKNCSLTIDNGSYIGNFAHIYSVSKIHIGKKVLIADKVYISDNLHGYENIDQAIIDQPIKTLKPVIINDGCWIGENVCVLGASIGKNSVIGANSVVTKDIPDFCIAVGSPAKVIKRFDQEKGIWEKVISNS